MCALLTEDNEATDDLHLGESLLENNIGEPEEKTVPLLPHYVYVLRDPRCGSIFYVGKGVGQRAKTHEMEAKRIDVEIRAKTEEETREGTAAELAEKRLRIAAIISEGQQVQDLVVGRYQLAIEAFAVEATLIKWVYGKDNLTNKVFGHHSHYIRPKENWGDIPGISIEEKTRSNDGSFRTEKVLGLQDAGAYEFIERVKVTFLSNGFSISDFSDLRAYDPGESNGQLAFVVDFSGIQGVVYTSKTKTLNFGLLTTEKTENTLAPLTSELEKLGISSEKNSKVRGRGRYRSVDGIKVKDNDDDAAISSFIGRMVDFKAKIDVSLSFLT